MVRQLLNPEKTDKWFFFILVYLFIDYGRPQDTLPIGFMRPGLIAMGILTFYLFNNGVSLSKSNQSRMIWYFIILTAMYIPFATNNYWALQTTKNMLLFLPFILSVLICVNSIRRLKIIINILISLMIYVSAYSLAHEGKGSGGYFHDENDVSLFINMWIPFCFFIFLQEKEFKKKVFYAAGLIIGVTAVVVSFSRGGFVGLVSVGFFIWLFSNRKILSLVLLVIVAMSVYYYSGETYINEMSTVTDQDEGTAQERLQSWEAGWKMFLDNPLGVGGNNFQWRFIEYQGDYFHKEMGGRVAHSIWFTLIPELGVIGVIIYLRLLFYNLKDIFYLKGISVGSDPNLHYLYMLSLAFIASLAGFFASGTFISVLYYPHYWYMTALIVAARMIYVNYESQELGELKGLEKS